jgi:hypothetical protein
MPRLRRHKFASFRPAIELLESRCVPTTITPMTFADVLGSGSLRDAVLQFNADTGSDDDIIQLSAGTYHLTIPNAGGHHETAGLTGDLNLTQTSHQWIIQGAGPSTIIDATQLQDRVFQIVNPGTQVVFQDLVIQGGLAQDNGSNGALAGTTDALGGGIFNNGGDVTLEDVVLRNNVARGGDGVSGRDGHIALGGGLYSTGGGLTVSRSILATNQATGGGGGSGSFYAGDGGNGGAAQGGGLYAAGGFLTLTDSIVAGNRVTGGAGGNATSSYSGGEGGTSQGGGLYVSEGILSVSGSMIGTNEAIGGSGGYSGDGGYGAEGVAPGGASQGGGLYSSGTLTLNNSAVVANIGRGGDGGGAHYGRGGTGGTSQGGGLYGSGTLAVTNSTIATNSLRGGGGGGVYYPSDLASYGGTGGTSQGGGLYAGSGSLTVTSSTIATNTLLGGYGGNSYFGSRGNGGTGGTSQGGGVYGSGTFTVTNSTIATNSLRGGDGGNSTYSQGGNGGAGLGGGLWLAADATAQITFSTIGSNQDNGGMEGSGSIHGINGPATGGGVNNLGLLQTHETILAGNMVDGPGTNSSPDLAGDLGSQGYNLIRNTQGGSGFDPTDLLNVDPLLGPLQDNGGPTQTMALQAGSPALNAGDLNEIGNTDQRGVIRTGGVNIGAYQASATAFVLSAPDTVQSGVPFDVTVTAVDPFNQVAVGYTGTVTFSTTDADPGVVLPADYTFTLDDGGLHTFTDTGLGETTLITPGDQTLNVMGTADNTITGGAIVTVNAGPGPAPHGQGPPPSTLQAGPAQGDAWTRSEPSANEVVAADQWFASFQPSDQGSATFIVTLNTQGPVHLTVTDTADNTVFAALGLIVL